MRGAGGTPVAWVGGFGLSLAVGCSVLSGLDAHFQHARGAAVGDAATPTCSEDIEANAEHCGRCGHSCLGGACVQGRCQPRRLAVVTGEEGTVLNDLAADEAGL